MRADLSTQGVRPSPRFWSAPLVLQPERRLMLAVLEDGVETFLRYTAEPGGRGRRLFVEIAAWFASDDAGAPFSFVGICDALDLEPSYIRAGLRRLQRERLGRLAVPAVGPRPAPVLPLRR